MEIKIIDVTPENIKESGIYCIKNDKSPGYKAKIDWFLKRINNGLRIKIALEGKKDQLGFIEFIPSEFAWRPIKAENYLFIHCIAIFSKAARGKNIGRMLIEECEKEAVASNKSGICTLSSDGPWMANRKVFEKEGFIQADHLERYELLYKRLDEKAPAPEFIDWRKNRKKFTGWNLIYADQCPWHEKSVTDIKAAAMENGIKLKIIKLESPAEARKSPSGFGVFSLIKDGKLLGDHYLSKTRFLNILKKELIDGEAYQESFTRE